MGIVIKQSLWSSIAAYVGVIIGYVNVVILMPKFLTPEEIGLYRTILSAATLFAPIPLFGLRSAFIRFFPRNSDQENNALITFGFITFGALLSILIFLAIALKSHLELFFVEKAQAINEYLWLILCLIGLVGIHGFFESILKAKKDITIPSIVRESVYKLLQTIALILLGLSIISYHQLLLYQSLIYVIIILIILIFVVRKIDFKTTAPKDFLRSSVSKEFFTYSRYALLSGLATVMVLHIDQLMISKYIGLEANAIYTTAIFIAVVIEMPRRFVTQIVQPIVSEDFKANRLEKIDRDYKKASINQLLIGSYIFLGIVINLPNIYAIMPNGHLYSSGISIVYIIGLSKIVNMVFSINGEIIVMSKHYRVNILLLAFLGIVTICMNLLFIPRYGINGAGFASLITFFLFNLIKYIYIRRTFKFSPFNKWTLPTLLLIPSFLLLNAQLPYHADPLIDIILRSCIVSVLFLFYLLVFKPSREIHAALLSIRDRINNA